MPTVNEYIPERLKFAKERLALFKPEGMEFPNKVFIGTECSVDFSQIRIGTGTIIEDNVVIRGPVQIGRYCHIKSGAIIGSKGFSFGFEKDLTPVTITHTGGVIIGDYVEIGALTTVCRGTVDNTIVKDHVKLDDHIHIAHNCLIGDRTIITAGVKFGGGVIVGSKCWFGLNSTIMNKVRIADYTLVGNQANIIRDTEPGAVMVGNPAKILKVRTLDNA